MLQCKICKYSLSHLLYQKNNYKYYLCKNCTTLFLYPLPSQKKLNNYYQKHFEYSAGEANEKNIRQRAKIILKNLKKLNHGGTSLLDIGSGYGYFLDEAIKEKLIVEGIEPSLSLSLSFTTINRLIVVKTNRVTFEEFCSKNNKSRFDFITIIHTIEHLTNPEPIIKNAIKLLNKDGILYIETPNLDSHLFRSEKQNYTFLTPPDHLWIFSQNSFRTIINKVPSARILRISSYSYPEHFMGIIKRKLKTQMLNVKINKTFSSSNIKPTTLNKINYKYLLFDKLITPIFTPFLNWGIYGSILELYIRKK